MQSWRCGRRVGSNRASTTPPASASNSASSRSASAAVHSRTDRRLRALQEAVRRPRRGVRRRAVPRGRRRGAAPSSCARRGPPGQRRRANPSCSPRRASPRPLPRARRRCRSTSRLRPPAPGGTSSYANGSSRRTCGAAAIRAHSGEPSERGHQPAHVLDGARPCVRRRATTSSAATSSAGGATGSAKSSLSSSWCTHAPPQQRRQLVRAGRLRRCVARRHRRRSERWHLDHLLEVEAVAARAVARQARVAQPADRQRRGRLEPLEIPQGCDRRRAGPVGVLGGRAVGRGQHLGEVLWTQQCPRDTGGPAVPVARGGKARVALPRGVLERRAPSPRQIQS